MEIYQGKSRKQEQERNAIIYLVPITIVENVTKAVHDESSMLKSVACKILRDIGFTDKAINHILNHYLRSHHPLEYSVKYYIESYFEGVPLEYVHVEVYK